MIAATSTMGWNFTLLRGVARAGAELSWTVTAATVTELSGPFSLPKTEAATAVLTASVAAAAFFLLTLFAAERALSPSKSLETTPCFLGGSREGTEVAVATRELATSTTTALAPVEVLDLLLAVSGPDLAAGLLGGGSFLLREDRVTGALLRALRGAGADRERLLRVERDSIPDDSAVLFKALLAEASVPRSSDASASSSPTPASVDGSSMCKRFRDDALAEREEKRVLDRVVGLRGRLDGTSDHIVSVDSLSRLAAAASASMSSSAELLDC